MSDIVQSDKNNVWHHLTQHKAYETSDPMVMVKGKGLFLGIELVADRESKQPVPERVSALSRSLGAHPTR